MRAIWNGAVSFGLVNVPVRLYAATSKNKIHKFTKRGVAWFAFNNRGSYVMRLNGGLAMERIRDCVFDIDGALRELRRRGYRDLTLIGHSTGANKIAVFDHYQHRNFAKRYVFLGGGDDTGLAYAHLGPRRFARALRQARAKRNSTDMVPAKWFQVLVDSLSRSRPTLLSP